MKTQQQRNREAKQRYADLGLCAHCGAAPRVDGRITCASCLENNHRWGRQYRLRLRLAAYNAYGGAICVCCGETHLEFLSLDHIGGGGAEHRRHVSPGAPRGGAGDKMYRWLRDKGYPPGLRVLCFNCNYATFRYGTCPHQTEQRPDGTNQNFRR